MKEDYIPHFAGTTCCTDVLVDACVLVCVVAYRTGVVAIILRLALSSCRSTSTILAPPFALALLHFLMGVSVIAVSLDQADTQVKEVRVNVEYNYILLPARNDPGDKVRNQSFSIRSKPMNQPF